MKKLYLVSFEGEYPVGAYALVEARYPKEAAAKFTKQTNYEADVDDVEEVKLPLGNVYIISDGSY